MVDYYMPGGYKAVDGRSWWQKNGRSFIVSLLVLLAVAGGAFAVGWFTSAAVTKAPAASAKASTAHAPASVSSPLQEIQTQKSSDIGVVTEEGPAGDEAVFLRAFRLQSYSAGSAASLVSRAKDILPSEDAHTIVAASPEQLRQLEHLRGYGILLYWQVHAPAALELVDKKDQLVADTILTKKQYFTQAFNLAAALDWVLTAEREAAQPPLSAAWVKEDTEQWPAMEAQLARDYGVSVKSLGAANTYDMLLRLRERAATAYPDAFQLPQRAAGARASHSGPEQQAQAPSGHASRGPWLADSVEAHGRGLPGVIPHGDEDADTDDVRPSAGDPWSVGTGSAALDTLYDTRDLDPLFRDMAQPMTQQAAANGDQVLSGREEAVVDGVPEVQGSRSRNYDQRSAPRFSEVAGEEGVTRTDGPLLGSTAQSQYGSHSGGGAASIGQETIMVTTGGQAKQRPVLVGKSFPSVHIPVMIHVLQYRSTSGRVAPPASATYASAANQLVQHANKMLELANTGISLKVQDVRSDTDKHEYLLLPGVQEWQYCAMPQQVQAVTARSQHRAACVDALAAKQVAAADGALHVFTSGSVLLPDGDKLGSSYTQLHGSPREAAGQYVWLRHDMLEPRLMNSEQAWHAGSAALVQQVGRMLSLASPQSPGCFDADLLRDTPPARPFAAASWRLEACQWCELFRTSAPQQQPRSFVEALGQYHSCGAKQQVDPIFNFMSDSPAVCKLSFTPLQTSRMQLAMQELRPTMFAAAQA